MLDDYIVGTASPDDRLVTLGELSSVWKAAVEAAAPVGLDDPSVEHLPAVSAWMSLRKSFTRPIDLYVSPVKRRQLALTNLAIESEYNRGQYIVDRSILTPREAHFEIYSSSPIATDIERVCIYFAKGLLDTSGIAF
jgi:hypothetical protein